MKIYTEEDLRQNKLSDLTVGILGFGNQGHAHAMNLRDSNIETVVGTRRGGMGWERAVKVGFESVGIDEATRRADVVVILLPDEVQGAVFDDYVRPFLKPGVPIVFPHGFTIAFDVVNPPEGHDIILVAPKGQGHYLRRMYEEGKGLPCLIAVEHDASGSAVETALSYASAIGCLSAGAIETTFREEAVTDLFGEQVVLCGGVPELVKAAFETLVDRGYTPEIAYLECMHELKIIADLMHDGGIHYMRERISRTAAWGSFETARRIVDENLRSEIGNILTEIESGEFAKNWMAETERGQKTLRQQIRDEAGHRIEGAGRRVRGLMPYLGDETKE